MLKHLLTNFVPSKVGLNNVESQLKMLPKLQAVELIFEALQYLFICFSCSASSLLGSWREPEEEAYLLVGQ